MDIYLRFPDEATFNETVMSTEWSVDVIGTIYEPPGVSLPGWHVNVRITDEQTPEWLAQYQVTPTSPVRGWL